ncbi:YfcE family phosphodiesterase [Salinicoccus roseus]|uniref:Phosphoesterase n=2 Tax=Salinicoccus roseus TaxID=45670 RepID=A0A265EAT2_9STAP|nr:YfcE family phosphodiesterase [Salinicoccus roseus]
MMAMRILIVSDNHGEKGIVYEAYGRNAGDLNIHLGDSEFNYDDTEMVHFERVRGNVDTDSRYPVEGHHETSGVFYTHGHYYDIKKGREVLADRAKEYDATYAFYGHSHVAKAEAVGGVYCINPGSISNSKGELVESYAVLDTSSNVVTFLDREHEVIKEVDLDTL